MRKQTKLTEKATRIPDPRPAQWEEAIRQYLDEVGADDSGSQGNGGVKGALDHEGARPKADHTHIPSPNHPWRKSVLTKSLNT